MHITMLLRTTVAVARHPQNCKASGLLLKKKDSNIIPALLGVTRKRKWRSVRVRVSFEDTIRGDVRRASRSNAVERVNGVVTEGNGYVTWSRDVVCLFTYRHETRKNIVTLAIKENQTFLCASSRRTKHIAMHELQNIPSDRKLSSFGIVHTSEA